MLYHAEAINCKDGDIDWTGSVDADTLQEAVALARKQLDNDLPDNCCDIDIWQQPVK